MYGRKNKYRNVKTASGFDSAKEERRFQELCLMERAGMIRDLQKQVRFELVPRQNKDGHKLPKADYIADFVYIDNDTGREVVEEVKGYRGGEAYRLVKLKKKLMLEKWGLWVDEI